MRSKLKVLHIGHHFWPCTGGMEKVMQDLCAGLAKEGVQSDVLCLNTCSGEGNILPKKAEWKQTNIFRVPYRKTGPYLVADLDLNLLKQYDVLHVHGLGYMLDYVAKTQALHGRPFVVTTHGGIFHTNAKSALKHFYFHTVAKQSLKKAFKVLAVSENDHKIFSRVSNRVELMENGIWLPRKGASKKKNWFLFVGRMARNKRVPLLVEKMLPVLVRMKSDLVVAGKTDEKILAGINRLKDETGFERVKILGEVGGKRLASLYSESRFFVSASQFEGFGLTLVEAMACGCVPVVQANESFSKIVCSGKNGFLVDFESREAGVDVLKAAGDPKMVRALSRNAVLRAREFDWKPKIKRLVAIYREAMAHGCGFA